VSAMTKAGLVVGEKSEHRREDGSAGQDISDHGLHRLHNHVEAFGDNL